MQPPRIGLIATLGCVAFAAFVTSPLQAQDRFHALKVCNEGNVDVRIATVHHEEVGFFGEKYVAEGWFAVPRRGCRLVYDEVYSDGVWLAVTFVDAYGGWRAAPIYPEDYRSFFGSGIFNLTSSNRTFCIVDGQFEWERPYLDELVRCPADSEGHEIPFTVWFGHPHKPGVTTFTIRPDLHAPAWTIDEPPRATRVPAPRTNPSPSPTVRAPQRPPKPLEAGTMNATLRGLPAVRWLSDGRWYWHSRPGAQPTLLATDPAVPSLSGLLNRHRFDLPEQYPQHGFEERLSVRRPLDRLAPATGARLNLSPSGRLTMILPANGKSSGTVLSANLYALDLDRAGFFMSLGVRILTVPCKLRNCVFLTEGDAVPLGAVETFNIPTTEASIEVLRGALRELLALFKPTDYTIENDVQCSCSRVVDRVVTK